MYLLHSSGDAIHAYLLIPVQLEQTVLYSFDQYINVVHENWAFLLLLVYLATFLLENIVIFCFLSY